MQEQMLKVIQDKKQEANNNLIKKMLKYKMTIDNLKSTKNDELVYKDYQEEKIQNFNIEHAKLMDISDGESLDDTYTGKKEPEQIQSKGKLAKILKKFQDHEENEGTIPEPVNLETYATKSTVTLPQLSPAVSKKSLELQNFDTYGSSIDKSQEDITDESMHQTSIRKKSALIKKKGELIQI